MLGKRLWRKANTPFVRAGLPLILFTVMGFAALTGFVQGKKEIEELANGTRSMTKRKYDLEEDYKATLQKLSPDFELKKIDRPE